MLKHRRNFVLLALVVCAVMAISCVKDVVLDAKEEPQVVVECILTDEPVQTLHLVYTKGASRSEAPDLPEAEVVLTDLTVGKEAGRFKRTPDGSWQLAYAAVPAHSYRLDVSVPSHGPIWAEQTMPEAPGIVVGWHRWDNPRSSPDDYSIGYTFRFNHIKDPVWFYGVNYPTLESPGEAAPYLCTNFPSVDPFNEMEGRPFGEEAEGNYMWGDKNSSGLRTTRYPGLEGLPRHKRYLRFPAQEHPDESIFQVSGFFQGYISDRRDFVHAEMRPAELHYFSASEDYDRFLKDSYHLLDLKLSTDLTDIFVRDNVYTNVQGAIGLFGAKAERKRDWEGRDSWYNSGYFVLASFATLPPENETNRWNLYGENNNGGSIWFFNKTSFLPFELIHFEYCIQEPYPDWIPTEWDNGSYTVEVIEDEEQLSAHGLVLDNPADFTKKSILYCAMWLENCWMPFIIGYGIPHDRALADYYWGTGVYGPLVELTDWDSKQDETAWPSACYFRFAILVDKEERYAPYIRWNVGIISHGHNHRSANSLVKGLDLDGFNPFDYE